MECETALGDHGYRFIVRSAGTHTPLDLLVACVSDHRLEQLAVQVKGGARARTTSTCSSQDMKALHLPLLLAFTSEPDATFTAMRK